MTIRKHATKFLKSTTVFRTLGCYVRNNFLNKTNDFAANEVVCNIKALSKKKREKERHVFHEPESDYHFAMIMGCTSGGFPYGVTHEEMEEIMKEEQKRLNNRQK